MLLSSTRSWRLKVLPKGQEILNWVYYYDFELGKSEEEIRETLYINYSEDLVDCVLGLDKRKLPPMYLVIAGGRDFSNYNLLKASMSQILQYWSYLPLITITGKAKGADSLGERFSVEHNIPFLEYPADWDTFGKSAGYRRNAEMAKKGTHLLAFHDGKSRGTKHMIDLAKKENLKTKVVRYV